MEKLIKLRKRINELQDQMDAMQMANTNGLSANDLVKMELAATKARIRFEKAQGDYLVLLGDTARAQVAEEDEGKVPAQEANTYDPKAPLVPVPDWDKEGSGDVVADFEFKSRQDLAIEDMAARHNEDGWKGDVSARKK